MSTEQRAEQVRNDFASAIHAAAGEWLPLSVRYAAADAAIAVVSSWQDGEADRSPSGVHKPFTDDGVTYCGWDGHEGCGEVWPCRAITEGAET